MAFIGPTLPLSPSRRRAQQTCSHGLLSPSALRKTRYFFSKLSPHPRFSSPLCPSSFHSISSSCFLCFHFTFIIYPPPYLFLFGPIAPDPAVSFYFCAPLLCVKLGRDSSLSSSSAVMIRGICSSFTNLNWVDGKS